MRKSFLRCVWVCLIAGGWLGVSASQGAPLPEFATKFFQEHCYDCHDQDTQKGNLQLDNLTLDFSSTNNTEALLGKIFRQLDQREMPPPKKKQPTAEARETMLDWLSRELQAGGLAQRTNDGRVAVRRLNRVEYQNTMHDLLGIEANLADLLPDDSLAFGFDKISSVLRLTSVQMEKYLEAADVALDAVLDPSPPPQLFQQRYTGAEVVDRWDARSFRKPDESGVAVLFNSAESPTDLKKFRAPEVGTYVVRIFANGIQTTNRSMKFRGYGGNFNSGGKSKLLGYFEAPADKPALVELTARLDNRRDTLKFVPYGSVPWHNDALTYSGPGLAIHWVEVEGPIEVKNWPPVSRRLVGSADLKKGTIADGEKILRAFAPRAFRRPLADEEVEPYVKLMRSRMERGATLGEALRTGLKAVLVSPRFLMLEEKPGRLDGYALAARLSYFLWSTMPDDLLLEAAAKGALAKPDELRAQVERMLQHPKARAFTEDFTGQWLGLRNIDFTTPDAKLYPEFDEFLQVSMVQETRAFFDELLRNDLSLMNFVQSDFAMLNERLGRHYGIPSVTGLAFQKVALPAKSHRGGIMTHASILKISANGTTTSPVIRGAWVLERVLGKHVPPPPPNVPSAEPDIRGAIGIRDQLARHRADPACAGCHARFDAIGFALESYDVIGGWRERYRITPAPGARNFTTASLSINQRQHRVALGKAVDVADELPSGQKFKDLEGLKTILLEDPEPITRGLTEKLLIYATGQGLTAGDEVVVREIVKKAKQQNYGLRSLVHDVIASPTFQTK